MGSDLPGTSERNGRHRIMQSLLVVLTLILINMRSHLFCMVLTIAPSVAPSGYRPRTSLKGVPLALLFQHACWRCPSCYRPWCSTCTLRPSIRIWKGLSLQKLKAILAKVWTSWMRCVGVCCPQWKLELATNFSFRTFFIYLPYKEYATKYLNWTCTVCTNKPKPFWVEESHLKSSIKELLDPNQLKDTWCKYWEICT